MTFLSPIYNLAEEFHHPAVTALEFSVLGFARIPAGNYRKQAEPTNSKHPTLAFSPLLPAEEVP